MKRRKNIIRSLLACSLLVLLAACGEEVLYNDLSQEDANKVMVLLQQNGIAANLSQDIKQNEVFWTIKVDKNVLSKAREIIVTNNVISPRAPGLKEVYQGKGSGGWIRTPAEERARYLLALKGEIINSLMKLPDVVDADVVLNIPQEEELATGEKKRPTASVVLKAQVPKPGETSLQELKVQEFVSNSVEGLSPRDVSVLIHYLAPMATTIRPGETITLPKIGESRSVGAEAKGDQEGVRLMGLKLDTDSRDRLKVYLIIFFAVLVVLSVALIVSIVQSSRTRQELKTLKSGGGNPALEGQVLDERGSPRLNAGNRERNP